MRGIILMMLAEGALLSGGAFFFFWVWTWGEHGKIGWLNWSAHWSAISTLALSVLFLMTLATRFVWP